MGDKKSRHIHMKRVFKASLPLLWQVWIDPAHISKWWGPKGFTSTIHKLDFREGGEWLMTMHGPEGTNYPNRSIFREIVLFKKIVFEHFNPHFITTVLFEETNEGIQIDWTLVFDTPEMRDTVIRVHKADTGQEDNLDKLESYLFDL